MSSPDAPAGSTAGGVFKRLIIGRAVASDRMEHTLLPKSLALPVFSSDALSSVAYATEEMLGVLLLTTTASIAAGYIMPIAIAIAALLAIVITSYRQTVRAYPMGGGAYMVSKLNLGVGPSLVAGAALLTDYVLTVSVSITAGVLAITSVPSLHDALFPYRVPIALGFIAFVTLMNIRGVKESGSLFAVPTYAFIVVISATVLGGLGQCFFGDGCPQAAPVESVEHLATAAGAVTLFVILQAFSAGSTALTGVEAISDGVPAFRRPQAKNAAATLAILGVISISMFLGISFLASQAGVTRSHEQTVVAQIADAVFDGGIGLYLVQAFTAAILILAANTAYQDFPRLSSFLARDHFMPRQFLNRGDRLVFSNGIVGLALAAGFLIWVFDANLEALIHLYVLGVFTSFTLSQSGMIKHWLRVRREEPAKAVGWKRSIVINAVGAVTTGVVAVVVAVTKFAPEGFPRPGAWMVMVAVAVIVFTFIRIRTHYVSVHEQLRRGIEAPNRIGRNHVVLLVTGFGSATAEALGYIRSFRPQDLHVVYVHERGSAADLQRRWADFAPGAPELELIPGKRGGLLSAVRGYVRAIERDDRDFVTVVIPETVKERMSLYVIRKRRLIRLKAGLLKEPNVVVTDAPVVSGTEERAQIDGQPLIPQRTQALVFISSVNDATTRAVNYALTLRASETRAIHFALDPEGTGELLEEWAECGFTVPLEIVEAPFRDLTGPMLKEVRKVTKRPDTLAAVVIPEFLLPTWRHELLHNQNALFVKRLFLYEPRVVLSSVPFVLDK
ncbi:MAG: APC family permease [Actinomycetota bacterium]